MVRFILKRLAQMVLILFAVSILIFALVRMSPSDPIASLTKGKRMSQETKNALITQYHLDRSEPEQYFIWISGVLKGDLGSSFEYRDSVNNLLAARFPTTLQIVIMSSLMALILAVPIGIISAVKMNTLLDRTLSVLTLIFVASPVFLTGIVMMLVFALHLKLFPTFGSGKTIIDNIYYLFLPSLALSLNMTALISRITRTSMIEQLQSPYASTALAKGLPYSTIVLKHCLKNALIPVITVASIQIGTMIVGAVLVENVFALGGIGALLTDSIKSSDYPVVQSITLILVFIFMAINLMVDIIYALIDPRIRPGAGRGGA